MCGWWHRGTVGVSADTKNEEEQLELLLFFFLFSFFLLLVYLLRRWLWFLSARITVFVVEGGFFFLFPRTQLQQSRKRKGNCSNSREELATIRSRNHCLRHVDVSFLSGREGFEFTAQIITCNSAAITPTTPDMSERLYLFKSMCKEEQRQSK